MPLDQDRGTIRKAEERQRGNRTTPCGQLTRVDVQLKSTHKTKRRGWITRTWNTSYLYDFIELKWELKRRSGKCSAKDERWWMRKIPSHTLLALPPLVPKMSSHIPKNMVKVPAPKRGEHHTPIIKQPPVLEISEKPTRRREFEENESLVARHMMQLHRRIRFILRLPLPLLTVQTLSAAVV